MGKIKLTNYTHPVKSSPYAVHKMYQVGMNNKLKRFKSEKAALIYLVKANQFLNECLAEVNGYNADLYQIYRRIYLYIDGYMRIEKSMLQQMNNAHDMFHRCIHNTVGPNGNYFAFEFLRSLVNYHLEYADNLNYLTRELREDTSRTQVRIIEGRLKSLLERLNKYPD